MMAGKPAGRLLGTVFAPPDTLAPYAVKGEDSRGRFFREKESATRSCYARDRDRIIHSTAFRRLMHKTQVFRDGEGDYFRTRMNHSLEVAQIARSFAKVLALNEELAEVVALAHDIGHAPFGHTGEDALNICAAAIGGFDHNAHALRLVSKLEHRYAAFDGLNLTWETLEGLVKHNGPIVGSVPGPIAGFDARWPLDLANWPGLEAQLAAFADDIAYLNHDVDDGLRARMFTLDELGEAPFAGPAVRAVRKRYGNIELGRLIGELVRALMGRMTEDVLNQTRRNIADLAPRNADDVRRAGRPMVGFSPAMGKKAEALKRFLFYRMYRRGHVFTMREQHMVIVRELYAAYCGNLKLLPKDWAARCAAGDAAGKPDKAAAVVRDYIAGMTDNFALQEHARICQNAVRR